MRRVIVCNIMSIDGFYASVEGNPLVLNMDEAFDAYNRERIEAADVVLLGRSSFEGFSSYWPHVANAPEDPDNRALSVDNRATSRAYNAIPKVVVSDSLQVDRGNPWYGTTTIVTRSDAGSWITAAREEGNGDILVFGSRVTWKRLLIEGMVDELHLMVSPTALGQGVPVFTTTADLALLETRRFHNSDNVLLRYAVK